MNDFDSLLEAVMEEATAAGIPVSDHIQPHVLVNRRAKKRFGQCIFKDGTYTIELSVRLLEAPKHSCKQTIAHELIHTCQGCGNHGALFLHYAEILNRRFGYHIKRTNSCEEMGIAPRADAKNVHYILLCEQCGKQIQRERYSPAVANPSRYRCRCGGRLRRIK